MMINRIIKSLLLLAILTFAYGCDERTEHNPSFRNVILTRVSALSDTESADYPGVVEEGASISASFMADGKIARLHVKEGDRVGKGQIIATLDDSDYRIGVAQLETQFNQMTNEKERMDAMFEKHNIAPNDYEKFEAGYEQLKLQLDLARRKLDYTRLYSPSRGYVAASYMNEGELVGAGTPVYNIVDDSKLMANVDLPVGVYIGRNKIKAAYGSVPGIEEPFPLSIVSFTPDPDNNMLYRMKLSIPSSVASQLTPGMNITVKLTALGEITGEGLIPSRALFSENGKNFVWTYNSQDSTIHKKSVIVEGAPVGNMNIVRGLSADDEIVEVGVKQLFEGEKVNVLNRNDIGL